MNYLDKLNPEQRKAALHKDGPLLILAGAGSGKTSTMTCRIANLIENEGVRPYNILAVTFTNKAAGEMRNRVEALVGGNLNMWILTFHSACLRILREHGDILGYEKTFAVYDPQDQKTLIKNCMKARNLGTDDKQLSPAYLLSIISDCKEKMISPELYLQREGEDFKTKLIYDIYKDYEASLKKNNAMDFDDLLLNTVKLFQRDESILLHYRNRFRYIMVDEYQDTNYLQYLFVRYLAEDHKNLCVVGDDDQCIYQWRGADIKNILDFEKDFKGTQLIKLEQNYRSYGNILAAAHSVVEKNRGRKAKKLWTSKAAGEKLIYYRGYNERDEAAFIAKEIERLKGQIPEDRKSPYTYKDFAILYRTNAQSRTFEEALSAKDITYRVVGGLRYYDRKEIKDIMSYMRLVQNPADDLALVRVINEPKRGIGDKTVEKLATLADVRGESLLEVLQDREIRNSFSAKAAASLEEFVEAVSLYHREQENLRISDIYDGLLVKTGYLKALEEQNTIEAESRIENLMEFKSVIYQYEKEAEDSLPGSRGTLADFMEKMALMADIDNHDPSEDAVALMTMHSAKGLEFPVVFLPGMEDGLFPGWRALDNQEGLEEERRLCYVGMTRAMEKLYLTGATERTLYGRTDYTKESRFLKELDPDLVEGLAKNKSGEGNFGNRNAYTDGIKSSAPYRPFDSLKYAKMQTVAGGSGSRGLDLAEGHKVSHAKFGEGLVINVSGNVVTIVFDSVGVKKLAKDIAPLTLLDS